MPVSVEVVTSVTAELEEAMARLVPQLSSSNLAPDRAALHEITCSPCTLLLAARDGERIVGSLTLVMFRLPTGMRAWIEDVVVDGDARGRGIGEALSRRALELARGEGAVSIDLTSRPSREAANRLYRRMGFEKRETNVYRYRFD